MSCPDEECHENLRDLKEDMKQVKICVLKKISRWELWLVIIATLAVFAPMLYSMSENTAEWKKEREEKSAANRLAIEIFSTKTQKEIENINGRICDIQKQQEQLPEKIYNVVKNAIKDSEKRK